MIRFVCPKCEKKINAPVEAAGKKAPCPGCKTKITVPSLTTEKKITTVVKARNAEIVEQPSQIIPFREQQPVQYQQPAQIVQPQIIHVHAPAPVAVAPAPAIHITNTNTNVVGGIGPKRWSPLMAGFLSFILPGLGQLYKGQAFNGLAWFVLTAVGYFPFVIPGVLLHIFCIIGAMRGDPYR